MLMSDQAPHFETCPRCGMGGYERFKTHTYCVNCNYSEFKEDYSYENQSLRCEQYLKDLEAQKLESDAEDNPKNHNHFDPEAA